MIKEYYKVNMQLQCEEIISKTFETIEAAKKFYYEVYDAMNECCGIVDLDEFDMVAAKYIVRVWVEGIQYK